MCYVGSARTPTRGLPIQEEPPLSGVAPGQLLVPKGIEGAIREEEEEQESEENERGKEEQEIEKSNNGKQKEEDEKGKEMMEETKVKTMEMERGNLKKGNVKPATEESGKEKGGGTSGDDCKEFVKSGRGIAWGGMKCKLCGKSRMEAPWLLPPPQIFFFFFFFFFFSIPVSPMPSFAFVSSQVFPRTSTVPRGREMGMMLSRKRKRG